MKSLQGFNHARSPFPRLTYPCSFLSHQVGKGELSLHGIPLCFHLCVRLLQISKGFLTLLSTKAQWILYSLFSPIQMKRKLQNLTHVNSPFDQEYCDWKSSQEYCEFLWLKFKSRILWPKFKSRILWLKLNMLFLQLLLLKTLLFLRNCFSHYYLGVWRIIFTVLKLLNKRLVFFNIKCQCLLFPQDNNNVII